MAPSLNETEDAPPKADPQRKRSDASKPKAKPAPKSASETLVDRIKEQLGKSVPSETIQLCGLAPLKIIATQPEHVLELAREKLNTWKYVDVPVCWRRLFEEASLHLVLDELPLLTHSMKSELGGGGSSKENSEYAFRSIVKHLDGALVIAGAPGRRALIEEILKYLDSLTVQLFEHQQPNRLVIKPPPALQTAHDISRAPHALDFEEFQLHLATRRPIIIPNTFNHWSAKDRWLDTTYLKKRTLGGHRLVPVERGASYNEPGWAQSMITFGEFIDQYLTPKNPETKGYLAQHDLFAQAPVLMNDISVPDYCYTTPPPPKGAAADTPGLDTVKELDQPLMNAWLGPSGTKSPLHTDPYHNVLCQVVGYKYVRLYAPGERDKLYPEGENAAGVSLNNTSQVDIRHFRPSPEAPTPEQDKIRKLWQTKYPLFQFAPYQEAILKPGECLYIPLGWWHYVEAFTPSFSVSFWWN